jgi:hypothetical protein
VVEQRIARDRVPNVEAVRSSVHQGADRSQLSLGVDVKVILTENDSNNSNISM